MWKYNYNHIRLFNNLFEHIATKGLYQAKDIKALDSSLMKKKKREVKKVTEGGFNEAF